MESPYPIAPDILTVGPSSLNLPNENDGEEEALMRLIASFKSIGEETRLEWEAVEQKFWDEQNPRSKFEVIEI